MSRMKVDFFLLTGHNWDPSTWCVQGQQSHFPCMYTSAGGYGYFSSMPPTLPGSSASVGQSFQRGTIRPTAKLSQKHQQLWEAQVCVYLTVNLCFI